MRTPMAAHAVVTRRRPQRSLRLAAAASALVAGAIAVAALLGAQTPRGHGLAPAAPGTVWRFGAGTQRRAPLHAFPFARARAPATA